MNKSVRKNRNRLFLAIGFILLIIYTILFLAPLIWAVFTSFKGEIEFMIDPFGFPKEMIFTDKMFDNYKIAFDTMYVPVKTATGSIKIYSLEMIGYSLIYAILCTVMHVLTPCIAAYGVAKFDFKLGKVMYTIVIVTMLLPIVGNLPSEIRVAKFVGFYDSFFGLAIMKGHFLGSNFLIFYAAFKGIAKDYSEAAQIEGANQFQIMIRIIIPLIKPTISAIALLSFISFWNDYTTPMLFLPSYPTIAYGLFTFNNSNTNISSFVTVKIAGCLLVSFPILIVYVVLKNKLHGNMTMGGIKG